MRWMAYTFNKQGLALNISSKNLVVSIETDQSIKIFKLKLLIPGRKRQKTGVEEFQDCTSDKKGKKAPSEIQVSWGPIAQFTTQRWTGPAAYNFQELQIQ